MCNRHPRFALRRPGRRGGSMRNPALEGLDPLVGTWDLTLTNAWFLESMEVEQHGRAVVRWLGDAFLELTAEIEGEHVWHFVFGRSDATDRSVVLYHDPRPASRIFSLLRRGRSVGSPPRGPGHAPAASCCDWSATASKAGPTPPTTPVAPGARTSTSSSTGGDCSSARHGIAAARWLRGPLALDFRTSAERRRGRRHALTSETPMAGSMTRLHQLSAQGPSQRA